MTDDHEIRKSNRYALIGVVLTIATFVITIFTKAIITVYSTQERVIAVEKRTEAQDHDIEILRQDVKEILLRDQPKEGGASCPDSFRCSFR